MEVLLLLCRESRRGWRSDHVAKELYIQPEAATEYLAALSRDGCCIVFDDSTSTYRYDSTNAPLHEMVQELAAAYKTRPVAVVTRIFSKPHSHLRLFSDAFKFRRDD